MEKTRTVSRVLVSLPLAALLVQAQTPVGNPQPLSIRGQPFQRAEVCQPCHPRQYAELRSAVKSGYRNHSPLFNSLELASNFVTGGALRPVYSDSNKIRGDGQPFTSNMITSERFEHVNQTQAGFCIGCHNPHMLIIGDADPSKREVPELPAIGAGFRPDQIRPLRDYHYVDSNGKQILPADISGPPPAGASPSLGAAGITCDVCHNIQAPDLDRSPRRDGLANNSIEYFNSASKVGSLTFAAPVKDQFHVSSRNESRRGYLQSSDFCGGCHDVRVPTGGSLTHFEQNLNEGSEGVNYFRLENLNTEWLTGVYNSENNPFGQVVRCQDCHMSLYPYGGDTTYTVEGFGEVTSPTPAVFATNFAGEGTDYDYPVQLRKVSNHYFTGVDVPLLSHDELKKRLGDDYPPIDEAGIDENGMPRALTTRREDLIKAAVRISLDESDSTAKVGEHFMVRLKAVALSGHRFPSGFSQERTAYVQLTVKDANDFLLYQSGYVVDKPHPDTGEMEPDGNLDDEDLEHAQVVVDPGRNVDTYAPGTLNNGHLNFIFAVGPDNGPEARIFAGEPKGLVLWRNELTHIFMPGERLGRPDADGNDIVVTKPHFEETFSAGLSSSVDNFRALPPLKPKTFPYEITLPDEHELELLGVELHGPLRVHAQVNFVHFPALFMRFVANTTSKDGPSGRDMNIINEQTIDDHLVNIRNIASADFEVELEQ